jgi:hypothetical protein
MAADPNEKNWWERNVEDTVAESYDRQRAAIPEYDHLGRLKHDATVGAMKGAYSFGKSMVVGLIDVAIVANKLRTGDPATTQKAWDITKKVAKEAYLSQFGTPQEKLDQNKRANEAIYAIGKSVADSMKKDWAEAERKGTQAELISKWATEGVLNVASFFVGAGEVNAAAKAARTGELLETGAVLARVTGKCPKLAALEEAAALSRAKAVEDATRAAEESAQLAKRLPATGAGPFTGPADEAYEAIRASTTDVEAIARNTGIKPKNIQKVKDHLFYEEHLLDRYADMGEPGVMQRFDSDAGIAAAWKRLADGNFTEADLQLLRHETAEAWYMRKNGPSYNAAHNAAQKRYPAPDLSE